MLKFVCLALLGLIGASGESAIDASPAQAGSGGGSSSGGPSSGGSSSGGQSGGESGSGGMSGPGSSSGGDSSEGGSGPDKASYSQVNDTADIDMNDQDDDDADYEDDYTTTTTSPANSIFSLGAFDPSAAKSAMNDFFNDLSEQAREFTRNISPSMATFANRMEQAGFPSPLVHGFKEIKVPENSVLPSFVPNIPSMGPFNPAAWSQEQIDAAINPPALFNGFLNPNTVTEIPGLGRFSLAIPPVTVETPLTSWLPNGGGIPSFIKYERIPGEPPAYLNFPELGLLNPANAYTGHRQTAPTGPFAQAMANGPFNNGFGTVAQVYNYLNQDNHHGAMDTRQLSVAGDLIQNSFERLSDIVSGAGNGGGILGQNVIDPVLSLVRRGTGEQGILGGSSGSGVSGGLLSNLLDRTQRIVQQN